MARSDAGGTVTVNNADHFQRRENTRSPHVFFAAAVERILQRDQGGFGVQCLNISVSNRPSSSW